MVNAIQSVQKTSVQTNEDDLRMYNFLHLVVKAYALAKTIFEGRQVSVDTILMLAKAELLKVAPEFRDLMSFFRLYETAYLILQQERDANLGLNPQSSNASGHAHVQATLAAVQAAVQNSVQIPAAVARTVQSGPTPTQTRNDATANARYHPYHNSRSRPQNSQQTSESSPMPSQLNVPRAVTATACVQAPSQSKASVPRVTPAPITARAPTPPVQNISQNSRKREADSTWENGPSSTIPQQGPPRVMIQNGAKRKAGAATKTRSRTSVRTPVASHSIVYSGAKSQPNAVASSSRAGGAASVPPQAFPQMLLHKSGKRKVDPSWDTGRDTKRPNSGIPAEIACCWGRRGAQGGHETCRSIIPSDRESISQHLKKVHQLNRGYVFCLWGNCPSDGCLTQSNVADHIREAHLGADGNAGRAGAV